MKGQFQLENASSAIASLRVLENLNIKDNHIINGVKRPIIQLGLRKLNLANSKI